MLNQESDIRVVGEASDGHEAFSLAMEKSLTLCSWIWIC